MVRINKDRKVYPMKRLCSIILLFIMLLTFAACSSNADAPKHLDKEGLAPYPLSESEKYILQSLGMAGSNCISKRFFAGISGY